MMQKMIFLTLALALTLLVACNTNVPVTQLLPTQIRSSTKINRITPTLTFHIPPTPTASPTKVVSKATESALATSTAICNTKSWFDIKTSPDGQWTAVVCDHVAEFSNFYLHVVKQDGSKEWQLSFKDVTGYPFFGYTNQFGEQAGFPSVPLPYHWYKDSRYLFIAPQVIADGNQSDGLGLYRFDTQTGRYTPFLPSGESSYNFAFSPDDEYYVYSYGMDNKAIHIASLETGEEQTVQVADGQEASFRRFLWSPDSTKFVFIYDNLATSKSALLLFDTIQKTLTTLLEIEDKLIPIRWASEVEVVLEEYTTQGQQYLLNIDTKVLDKISK